MRREMKILFFIFILFVFACKKDSKCYICGMRTIKSYGAVISDKTVYIEKCDKTVIDIFQFQQENTETYYEPTPNDYGTILNIKVQKTCYCNLK